MHTSQEKTCFQCLTRSKERSRGAHGAFFDFAQNEEEFDMPSTAYLILSEVEGRTTPMQCSKMCACPSAKAGAQEQPHVAHRWVPAPRLRGDKLRGDDENDDSTSDDRAL